MTYQLVTLSPVANDLEQLGTKEKFWFYYANDTDNLQLFKYSREGANKQVISSQADSLIKISRIWADFFPANTSNQPI